ncbi:MAG: YggS family pyridoxal phosphate-dependent enzyme [Planctomycetaceae bacterium]|nr:YggS family pyridoxal phosphate-dependent enzyme [Planctomycetaceae bacterium]
MDNSAESCLTTQLRTNLGEVRNRIAIACRRAGRHPDSVRLVAVTKYSPVSVVEALWSLGEREFGESRPQQLIERAQALNPEICWHQIGRLQRNKVRAVLPYAKWIHSVDSTRLLERISEIAGELSVRPKVLLQVNVSGEPSKQGFAPDELKLLPEAVWSLPHVEIAGLMTMAPDTDELAIIRQVFLGLRRIRSEMQSQGHSLPELSMGMSHDFEIAIEEGATMIRLGSILFEGCD